MPRKKAENTENPEKMPGIEENFSRLEDIIRKLEAGDSSLEETFAGYEAGMKLVKSLSSQIDKVEKQIQILSEGDDNE
ncbi:MAG: exodeoxyribonuclease VII small subunit [Enterocloster sp.]